MYPHHTTYILLKPYIGITMGHSCYLWQWCCNVYPLYTCMLCIRCEVDCLCIRVGASVCNAQHRCMNAMIAAKISNLLLCCRRSHHLVWCKVHVVFSNVNEIARVTESWVRYRVHAQLMSLHCYAWLSPPLKQDTCEILAQKKLTFGSQHSTLSIDVSPFRKVAENIKVEIEFLNEISNFMICCLKFRSAVLKSVLKSTASFLHKPLANLFAFLR